MALQWVWLCLRKSLRNNKLMMCRILIELLKILLDVLDSGDYADGPSDNPGTGIAKEEIVKCIDFLKMLEAGDDDIDKYGFPELLAAHFANCLAVCLKAARESDAMFCCSVEANNSDFN